ncbi:hypothetical protein K491DRAFT_124748 [Lophiostoma macrostomum CBS 122681]|uniref:DUF6594 domain-containing protein n=1 Tax=Lophiostoma macrostomum CBS 122681 TaxID=1314788 RepID=A0A6A6TN11_9PLEO|nr:hypothetical protein K491DRAFT_124748 [Lophiostoma macrostomum CBS 122681]
MMGGYSTLATLMGAYPEVGIFRRFGALNTRNLLYLQAEVTSLEKQLIDLEKADLESGHPDRSIYSCDWRTLAEPIEVVGRDETQWKLFLRLREKLYEYNTALLEQVQMSKLNLPNLRDLDFLVRYMKTPSMGNVYLLGPDSDIWENPDLPDLISLNPKQSDNWVSRAVTVVVAGWLHRFVGRIFKKPKDQKHMPHTVSYSYVGLERISRLLMTTVASTLPVVSIIVLYSVSNMSKRLGLMGLFTALFSLVLGLLTNGKPIEIFSATAAFAAVQVVFISTNKSS